MVTVAVSGQARLTIASGSNDQTICVWDAISGHQVLTPLRGHTDKVSSVRFSSNGSQIVSGSYENTICVWNSVQGEEILKLFQGDGGIWSVAVSSDCI
jgi:WD40 repeat protein